MNHKTLEALLPSLLSEIEGKDGFWRGTREDVSIYVLCDEEHNRMRVMAPIGELRDLDAEFLALLLRSNFDRALDAKFAMRGQELWSLFVHPLSTLVSDDLGLFIDQVVTLVRNTGTTYASTDLVFGLEDEPGEATAEYEIQDDDEDDEEDAG